MSTIINPHRFGVPSCDNLDDVYYGPGNGQWMDPAHDLSQTTKYIRYDGDGASFHQNGFEYDLRLFPNYKWYDENGNTTPNDVPSGVSAIYYDYNTTHMQQCYLTGTTAAPREHPFTGNPSSYSSLNLTGFSGDISQTDDYIVIATDSEFEYRYIYTQYRLRAICNGETIASDWYARPLNIAFMIEADLNDYCSQNIDGCGYGPDGFPDWVGVDCHPTYAMFNACSDSAYWYLIDSNLSGGAVANEFGIYDVDGNATTYACARFEYTYDTFGQHEYFEGEGELYLSGFSDCTECENNLP